MKAVAGMAVAVAATLGITASAAGAPLVRAKAGHWNGYHADTSYPVFSFDVAKRKVSNEVGSAPSNQDKCPGAPSFAIPQKVVRIKDGHFKASSNSYIHHVRVTYKGTFTSRTKAKGYMSTAWPNKPKCNDKLTWRATYVPPTG